ncbi:hypothetical protein [Bacillus methanolicus]|uniref:Uncharacterized protein n=1 Tax=Bacillus methanolicus (strain MGA3 / ATCC 53907) TaxID=796606 RepID=I3E3L8_BACMM|nr:hypothetical protein [Bacillus methanolicus]AIE58837.1 hypothetical protein BMMGA3_01835 [Bacillus methanolicus MGA3]EIJ81089.1 hypothetical protein MGA3_12400 [Bacillus methanolicus MGA3]UQD50931.1 hypothetical protein C0971_01890 [Bacillus methanolicus]
MQGISFINERKRLHGLSSKESIQLQKEILFDLVENKKIHLVKLNPYQLYDYYTIPHALLYDLKLNKPNLDCLVIYSPEVIEEFIHLYPARWILLKSYFNEIITAKP